MHHPSTSWRSRLSSQGYSKDSLEITVSRGGAAPGVLIMLRIEVKSGICKSQELGPAAYSV